MKQTDECYTPPKVYDAVAEWVREKTGLVGDFARPFYPGGDYENFAYTGYAAVVDNPPFSVITKITRFYSKNGIPFFLFAPALTALRSARHAKCCAIYTGDVTNIKYENNMVVRTAFVSNLFPGIKAMSAPEIGKRIAAALGCRRKAQKEIAFPPQVIRATDMQVLARWDIPFAIKDGNFVEQLDCGARIYGGALLVDNKTALKMAQAKEKAESRRMWNVSLSDRELSIIRGKQKP